MKMKQNSLDIANPVYDRFTLFIFENFKLEFYHLADLRYSNERTWPADDDN